MKTDRADYVIVGNSTAAVGAVEGIRGVDANSSLLLISKENRHTYSRPLISYLLAGEVNAWRMRYRPADFYEKHRVEARLGTEVVGVDPDSRTVRTGDGAIGFGKLLVACGGKPIVPDMPGRELKGVFRFTSWDDAETIDTFLRDVSPSSALVVGGGLIGIKAAEALHARGLAVRIVELADRVMPLALDAKASAMAMDAMRAGGVEVACGTTVESILGEGGRVTGARLRGGREVTCDLVVIAIGVAPDLGIVKGTSISTDRGILIDDKCETSVPGIFAAGDVSQGADLLGGKSRPVPIFPNAYRQGEVAGTNMAGGEARMAGALAMNSIGIFGMPVISVGLAAAEGKEYEALSSADGNGRTYKRIVLRNGRIVGALLVGDVERAGIFTGLIRQGVDVSEFKDLLLSEQFGLLSLPTDYRKHVVRGEGIEV